MGKQRARKNINFRQTRSERSATNCYRAFGKYRKEKYYDKNQKGSNIPQKT